MDNQVRLSGSVGFSNAQGDDLMLPPVAEDRCEVIHVWWHCGTLGYLNNHYLAVIIPGHERRYTLMANIRVEYSNPGIAIMPLVFKALDEGHNNHLPERHASQYHQHPDNEVPPPGSARFLFNKKQWFSW